MAHGEMGEGGRGELATLLDYPAEEEGGGSYVEVLRTGELLSK